MHLFPRTCKPKRSKTQCLYSSLRIAIGYRPHNYNSGLLNPKTLPCDGRIFWMVQTYFGEPLLFPLCPHRALYLLHLVSFYCPFTAFPAFWMLVLCPCCGPISVNTWEVTALREKRNIFLPLIKLFWWTSIWDRFHPFTYSSNKW